jgi:WD40 repeat protein
MLKKIFISLVFGLAFFFQRHLQADASTKIISLGRVPDGYTILVESLKYSKDMRHVTYVMRNDKNQFFVRNDNATSRPYFTVFTGTPYFTPQTNRHAFIASTSKNSIFAVVDGKAGPVFDEIDNLWFSADESHFTYRAVKGDLQCIVVDHIPQKFYDGIPIKKNLVFSLDNKHFAYVAYNKENKQCTFVLDGKELNSYKMIEDVIFSPDSNQYAYMALEAKDKQIEAWRVVHNGNESDIYNKIFSITFSPDSKKIAFVALKGTQMALVVDKKETIYERVGITVFSLDSKRMAYAYLKSKKWYINVDEKDGPSLDNVFMFFFSPDASQFAYNAIQGESQLYYINHSPDPIYDKVGEIVFSPNSKRYAYGAVDEKGARVVVDGKPNIVFTSVGEPKFSPDSRNYVYKGFIAAPYTWCTILNGKIYGNAYYSVEQCNFSPDSRHIAYRALKQKGQEVMVVDGNEHDIYRIAGIPFFSPEGNHIAYHCMQVEENEKENWYLVVDGQKLPEIYGGFIRDTPIVYDADNQFHTIALRSPGPEFLNIEVTIPQVLKIKSGI